MVINRLFNIVDDVKDLVKGNGYLMSVYFVGGIVGV